MHAVLTSLGTDGDVLPYVGLGRMLRARGHRVTLVTSEGYAELAAAHGLEFQSLLSRAETTEIFGHPEFWHPLKGPFIAARGGMRNFQRQYELLAGLCDGGSGAAVLVASPGVLAARLVQEARQMPMVSILLQPWMAFSRYAPPVMPTGMTLPAWAPRPVSTLYLRTIDAIGYALLGKPLNALRIRLRLPRVYRPFRWWFSPQRIIGMYPAWYGPLQPDAPPQLCLAGFPPFDGTTEPDLPPALADYCAGPGTPIAFTFGTGMAHGQAIFEACAEACDRLGRRGLFITRHAGQLPNPLPSFIRHVSYASFRLLFPACAAVVHHGGIGTTAAALAAGAPQLVLPLAFDQFDNAVRVKRLGRGDWLPRRGRTGERIADALRPLLENPNPKPLPDRSDLNGLTRAADLVEELAALGTNPKPAIVRHV
jgi:rhamnosyltransferase subunit B